MTTLFGFNDNCVSVATYRYYSTYATLLLLTDQEPTLSFWNLYHQSIIRSNVLDAGSPQMNNQPWAFEATPNCVLRMRFLYHHPLPSDVHCTTNLELLKPPPIACKLSSPLLPPSPPAERRCYWWWWLLWSFGVLRSSVFCRPNDMAEFVNSTLECTPKVWLDNDEKP